MGRRRTGQDIHGILLLDKPAGISSNQALQHVRRLLSARKAGHSGSLDPFATGMLPVCLGEATKTAAFMLESCKTYHATIELGSATRTGDIEGEVSLEMPVPGLSRQAIERVLTSFLGSLDQVPPMYSALKHQGQPLYKLARQGLCIERKPRRIKIHRIELKAWESPTLEFEVHCSKGTYIRTLAEDIATALGSCGHLVSLRRTSVEPFETHAMITLDDLQAAVAAGRSQEYLLPLDAGLSAWPRIELDPEDAERFIHGVPVAVTSGRGMMRLVSPAGRILGLAEAGDDGIARPKRVFVLPAVP
jgi:tRNA pseudouridine55 synthase